MIHYFLRISISVVLLILRDTVRSEAHISYEGKGKPFVPVVTLFLLHVKRKIKKTWFHSASGKG